MLTRSLLAFAALTALTAVAPSAHADGPTVACHFLAAHEPGTDDDYTGAAWGAVTHSEPSGVSIRCYITVNGIEITSTPTGTGSMTAATSGRVEFEANGSDDVVVLCAEATTSHGAITVCDAAKHVGVTPFDYYYA